MSQVTATKTDFEQGYGRAGDSFEWACWPDDARNLAPVEQFKPTTRVPQSGEMLPTAPGLERSFEAPVATSRPSFAVKTNSVPMQIWEGTVVEVNAEQGLMHVLLDAKLGNIPRHTGEIDLEWVSEQDQDLVVPGAIFYLTLYKRTLPSVENTQELRFRRRPAWSTKQLKQVARDAEIISLKLRPLPTAP